MSCGAPRARLVGVPLEGEIECPACGGHGQTAERIAAYPGYAMCEVCDGGGVIDINPLDRGPYLPGKRPRRKPAAKSPEELAAIRARAWTTRRARYGAAGHRGPYRR